MLTFDGVKNDGVKESAKHVWDAYFNADEWTKPESDKPKKVPGHAPHGPLHREVEGANADLVDPDFTPTGTITASTNPGPLQTAICIETSWALSQATRQLAGWRLDH
ncbi:hypothetical protein [Herbidospora mongoliensis]|uniref:hypothetical protein n=1 Tax=Herbidospora mongoliensis TaxID=688067 RepID=UPI0012FB7086|nr:hypothetical protein [Herbidospora mongoliensis]